MKINNFAVSTILLITLILSSCENSTNTMNKENNINVNPPIAAKKDTTLVTHDNERNDPYFWMRLSDEQKTAEQPDAQTQEVLDYLNNENEYTDTVMAHTEDLQDKLYEEIVGRIKKNDESVPYFENGYWYYTRFEDEKEYPIYCRKKDSLEADEEIMLDANERAEGMDYYSAAGLEVSPNNRYLAFAEDTVSRRIYTYRIKDLTTGEILPDEMGNAEPGCAWANDNRTLFYTTKNKVSLLSEKILRHERGTSSNKDVMVYHEKDPSFYIGVYKSKSDQYVIIYNTSTLVSDYHILNADNPKGEFASFSPRDEEHEYDIYHYQDKFYVMTNWDAKNFRLMETSAENTSKENWKEVIAHRDDVLLNGLDIFSNHLVLSERSNALTHLRVFDQANNSEHYIEFDEEAYVTYTSVNPEFNTEQLRLVYSSLTTPFSTYDYDMNKKTKVLKKQQEVVGGHDPGNYKTERMFAESRDGKKVPITLVYKKDINPSAETPMLLYAYGSYGVTVDPRFSSVRLSLLDRGFIFAIAHPRGSQMMGRSWYEDGKMFKKQNTFNDYVDCAKHLHSISYSSPEHSYAMGGSAGGLLMGAVLNQAPDRFNGVIAGVPFVDVVSTMLDESIPLTTNEFDEWGNPKNKDSYDYMLSYSPYDQVKAQDYPNILVTTGLFDSQVQYWEPAKWVAKLRDMKTDNNILLLKTNMEAGHGGASGRFKRYKETALEYAFMMDLEGIEK